MAKSKEKYANDVQVGYTQPVRVLFPPKLSEPVKIAGKGDPKYELTIGFPEDHPDYLKMYQICEQLATERDGDEINIDDWTLKFVSGDDEYAKYANHKKEEKRRDYPHLQGLIIMKLRSKQPISVFDVRRRDDKGIPVKITDKDEIVDTVYGGSYVALDLTFATYDGEEDVPGVTAYPEKVCFVNDGERLGGGSKDSGSSFAAVQGAISDEDPTGGEE